MKRPETRQEENTRVLATGATAALASLLLLGPSRFGIGLTSPEAAWLLDARGLAPRALDAWAGLATSDVIFRAPVIVLSVLAVLVTALIGARRVSRLAALAAAVAFAAELALLSGGPIVGSIAWLAAVASVVSVAAIVSPSRRRALLLAGAGAVLGLLEPGLAALPLGAAAGSLVPRRGGSGRTWVVRAMALALAGLAVTIVVGHFDLGWLDGEGRTARTLQKAILLASTLAVATAALRRRERDAAESPTTDATAAAMGGMIVALAWLLIRPLRETTTSPLVVLLMTAPVLGVLGLVAPRRMVAESATETPLRRRSSAATILAVLLAVVSLFAFAKRRAAPPDVLPLAEALGGMSASAPDLKDVLAGPGLTPGVLAHVARPRGLDVAESPRGFRIGAVAIASHPTEMAARDALADRIGERVLDRYGLAGDRTILRWTTFRPLSLRIDPAGPRPNIAIVSVDTLRADHLGVYGYSRPTSPRLDAWSKDAVVYERAMAAAPATAPSFSSLMTGRLPIAHGVRKNYEFLDPGHWTLARILSRAGYDTAGFISSFVLSRENSGLDLGIRHYDQTFEEREKNREDRPLRLAPALAASVGSWLDERRAAGRPWFVWVHAIDPHGPYTPLPEFRGTFQGGATRAVERSRIPHYQWLGTTDFASYVNAYDDEVLQTDRSLGALLAKMEALPAPAGTIVIFTADHGEAFGEHGFYFEHGQSLHDEEIHVPLIVKDTGRPRSGRVARPVSLLDVLPSLLRRLAIETDLPFDGTTLDARERPDGGPVILANWRPGQVMALQFPWKLLVGVPDRDLRGQDLLYNILTDPGEGSGKPSTHGIAHVTTATGTVVARDQDEELVAAAAALARRDPLTAASGRALERRQWEDLSPEAQEKLKSLGYAGP